MAHYSVYLPTALIPWLGHTWLGRRCDGVEWNMFLWHCKNVYDWSQRRSQGKRRILLATNEGAHMTPAQLNKKCEVTNIEWLMEWPWEQVTGRVQFPDPVVLDDTITMSRDVSHLRDAYLGMQVLCPNIQQPEFRWEQIDYWDIAIQFREIPQLIVGGSRGKYNPGVSGLVQIFGISRTFLMCYVPLAVYLNVNFIRIVRTTAALERAGVEGADTKMMWLRLIIFFFSIWHCQTVWDIHKGLLMPI
ncbi:hypothetical protein Vi05172_g6216 [Venturia inaequalis]|nr:hypothetical protein Vi05172_g6216 [Venturia inaequalis]